MAAGVPTCQGKFLSHDGATMAAAEAESRGSAALRPSDPWGSRSWRAGASREEIGHRRAPSRLPHASGELKTRIGNVLMYNVSIFCKKEKIIWKYSYTQGFHFRKLKFIGITDKEDKHDISKISDQIQIKFNLNLSKFK